ncbi:uncharacterized protein LOC144123716 [Amblyomma americanum]
MADRLHQQVDDAVSLRFPCLHIGLVGLHPDLRNFVALDFVEVDCVDESSSYELTEPYFAPRPNNRSGMQWMGGVLCFNLNSIANGGLQESGVSTLLFIAPVQPSMPPTAEVSTSKVMGYHNVPPIAGLRPSLVFISCCTQLSVDINDWKKSRCGRNIGRLLRSGDPRPPVHHAADEAAGHHQLAKGPTPGRGCFPACTRSWNSPSPRFHDLATIVGMRSSLVLLFCPSDIGMEMKERVRRS